MTEPPITFSVRDQIFGRTSYFTFGGTFAGFVDSIAKRYTKEDRSRVSADLYRDRSCDPDGLCWHFGNGNNAIYISAMADIAKPEGQGVLVHECQHAAFHVGDSVGFSRTVDAEEFFTHYTQFLYERAMRRLIK